MSSVEKKIAVILVVVLVAMAAAYVATGNKAQSAAAASPAKSEAPKGDAAAAGGASCAPSGASDGSVKTQEFGKKGAKLEIVACLPITHGCHVNTEAELKKAYKKHEKDIHLTIYDLFGPEGQKYVAAHGGQRAVVFINGETKFKLNGKDVMLERQEGMTYKPADIAPIIEDLLKKKA